VPALNGSLKFKVRNLAATVTAVKTSQFGQVFGVVVVNAQAAAAFIQVFDVATTAGVTLGTTTPDLELSIAGNTTTTFAWGNEDGVRFDNGIQIASTTTEGGLTGSAAGVQVFVQYK
jgi:hypothetical protein